MNLLTRYRSIACALSRPLARFCSSKSPPPKESELASFEAELKDARRVAELFTRELKEPPSIARSVDEVRAERFFAHLLKMALDQSGAQAAEVRGALEGLRADTDPEELARALRTADHFSRHRQSVTLNLKSEQLDLLPPERADLFAPLARPQPQPEAAGGPSFATLLRNDPLMALGDIRGRLVEGFVVEETSEHLYVDFGGKFLCVVARPVKQTELYVRGLPVLIRLESLEMISAFLASDTPISLREAKGTLVRRLSKEDGAAAAKVTA